MPRYEVTTELLHAIEDVTAAGAGSIREIAEFVGIPLGTFRNLVEGRRKNGHIEKGEIKRALKKGYARQIPRFVAEAETALSRKVNGETWFECSKEVRAYLWKKEKIVRKVKRNKKEVEDVEYNTLYDDNGDRIPLLDDEGNQRFQITEREFQEKSRAPSDAAIFFTLVNGSRQLTPDGEIPKWLHNNQQPKLLEPPVDPENENFEGFEFEEFTDEEFDSIQESLTMQEKEIEGEE